MSDNDSLVQLNGTITHADGSTSHTSKFEFLRLRPDDYSDIAFSPAQAEHIRKKLAYLSTGASAATPLVCGGREICPFSSRCPVVEMDTVQLEENPEAPSIIPVGRPCIVEVALLDKWTQSYLEQFDVDPHNKVDISHCQELAEVELFLWRINNNLSKPENVELVQEVAVGVDRDGNALTRQGTNAFYDARERLLNRKTRLMKLMVGDRESQDKRKAMLKLRGGDSLSAEASRLHKALLRASEQAARSRSIPATTPESLVEAVISGDVDDGQG